MKASGTKRERGAYFTPAWVARSLAAWSIRSAHDIVIDPAAGRGDLLLAAAERLKTLGSPLKGNLFGVELHKQTAHALRARLNGCATSRALLQGDFFSLTAVLPKCDVVLANPPFVRHQDVPATGAARMRAALDGRAHIVGGRASAWAYFLVHAPLLLKSDGRMAFVLPSDVLTSDYARPIIDHLATRFTTIKLVYCDGAVFQDLNQRVVLCLAEGYEETRREQRDVQWARLDVPIHLATHRRLRLGRIASRPFSESATLLRLLSPRDASELEQTLRGSPGIKALGDLARIGIGYVTGGNQFFHFSEAQRKASKIRPWHFTRVMPRSRAVRGLEYTAEDWTELKAGDSACWLLTPKKGKDRNVRRLLDRGRKAKVHKGYKCAGRKPWWVVPAVDPPAAFMSYMGAGPRIFTNSAGVCVPNSLFEIRDLQGVTARDLSIASMTSVFQLSANLNARLLGGGLRKLEPSDAARILVPLARTTVRTLARIDRLLRQGKLCEARRTADHAVLINKLAWHKEDVRSIQGALSKLEKGPLPPLTEVSATTRLVY